MNLSSAEDRAFCLAGLTRFGDRFQAMLAIIAPGRREPLESLVKELSAMDPQQRIAEWERFGSETYRNGDELAKRQLGVRLDDLPPLLRNWMLRNGNENH